jgi:hypothetical protein
MGLADRYRLPNRVRAILGDPAAVVLSVELDGERQRRTNVVARAAAMQQASHPRQLAAHPSQNAWRSPASGASSAIGSRVFGS